MRFDWYQCTVPTEGPTVLKTLLRAHRDVDAVPVRPVPPYQFGYAVRRGERTMARVFWGGANGDDGHAVASGSEAPEFAELVRDRWPSHRVSRVDAAEDFHGAEAWEAVSSLCLAVADEFGIKVEHAGDWHRGKEGRTLYLGGRASAVRLCGYEKGKQPEWRAWNVDPTWVRAEARYRPKGPQKALAARLSAEEVWGAAQWSAALYARLFGAEVSRLGRIPEKPFDLERAAHWMLEQYGPTLSKLADVMGTPCALGEWIFKQLGR